MTAIDIKKREGESINSLLYRFNKKIQQSGVLKQAKKKRFQSRPVNRQKRRLSAIYRFQRQREVERLRKYGLFG